MNFGFYRIALGVTLAALAVGATLSALAQPIRRGPSIKFSEPRRETVTTNLNALAEEKKNNLRRLEEELNNSFHVLNRDDASGAQRMLPRPPPGSIIQSRKVRELLERKDRKDNWVFDSPENRKNGLTAEEIMDITQLDDQGREESSIPAFERYYNSLDREGLGTTNREAGSYTDSREKRDALDGQGNDEEPSSDPLKAQIEQAEQGLRQSLNEDSGLKLLPTFDDSSAMPKLTESKDPKTVQSKLQESRLDQFKQMSQTDLTKPITPSVFGVAAPGSSLGGDRFIPLSGIPAKPAPSLTPPPTATPAPSGLSSAGLAASPSWAGASRSTPEPVVPRRTPPPSQFPETPRRKF
jgi:hypothetical protein